jgi:hypothetical protein
MIKYILIICLAVTTNRFYSNSGRYNGKSITSGNTTRFYDRSGRYDGKSIISGNTTRFYDRSGKYEGKIQK